MSETANNTATHTLTVMGDAWQPIETAPMDRTRVLVWYPRTGIVSIGSRDDVPFYGPGGEEPTHWKPLPLPPERAK